ncbi:DUF1707 domain-containing protein [Blastococcus jejuensis]|uniref:DUF1707 domain-containing protein n=1 Tax=Blastococcus jejuensis TaxID=351224 RepID=A0ABP6NWN0_9ACTN
MTTGREMRVSDRERQAAADRLKGALEEGRLDFHEYDHRLGLAYRAVTYADLDQLFGDLPTASPAPVAVRPTPPPPAAPVRQPDALATGFARLPLALKILWSIWSVAMAVNLTVWLLVGVGNGEITYFWPMWLLVPGTALAGATFATLAVRNAHRGPGER